MADISFSFYHDQFGCWLKPYSKLPGRPTRRQFERAMRNATGSSKRAITIQQRALGSAGAFLKMHPKGFAWGELVLEFGKEYVASDRGKCASFLPERSCFENAAQKARETNEELQYVEGLALSPLGPMLHAWNARGDEVFDFTWPCQHLVRYYGIPFSVSFLDEIGHKNGCVFGYLDPLLKYLREKIAAG